MSACKLSALERLNLCGENVYFIFSQLNLFSSFNLARNKDMQGTRTYKS